jgi:hypothetical protein
MKYKPDWDEAKERFTALWEGRPMDRPGLAVNTPNGHSANFPTPVSGEQKWLDPEFIVQTALAQFETISYVGESIPSTLLMAGWILNTYGATPHFPMETIWVEPRAVDWDSPPSFPLDWKSPWLKKVSAVHDALLDAAGYDDFLVGSLCPMPANDMLAFVIGTEAVLLGMADHPDWIREAIRQLTENWIELRNHFAEHAQRTHAYWYGNAGWMPFWAPEPFVTMQSDLSCMISPAMFEEFIVPELDRIGAELRNVWYHLDGQTAFQHLPRLLSMPYMKVIQFVPMPGTPRNGPAYLDLYRQIQQAGKIVHIEVPKEDVEPLSRELDPSRLMIQTYCATAAEAEELLESTRRWAGKSVG